MTEFQHTLTRLIDQSGKSVTQVSALSGVDRAYLTRLISGEKCHPSVETLFRLWMGISIDAAVTKEFPTFQHGLAELLVASAASNAKFAVMEVG